MLAIWRRIRESWRTDAERSDENFVENALLAHEQAEREKHSEQPLPPGRSNTDWTYINPN
jgi:hypothetical protein